MKKFYSPEETSGGGDGDKKPPKGTFRGRLPEKNEGTDPLPFLNSIQLSDTRKINPASGQPFKKFGTKGVKADKKLVEAIIAQAKTEGIDPQTALAVALQETNLGKTDQNVGHALGYYVPDEVLKKFPTEYQGVPYLIKALKDKMSYADQLVKKGVIPDSEEYRLQAYNGYGKLFPNTEVQGKHPAGQQGLYQNENTSFYEIPVTKDSPLDLKKNPAYGKTIKQLRDEIIKTNPEIQQLIEDTKPYEHAAAGQPTSYVPLNPQQRNDWNKFLDHLDATGAKNELTHQDAATAALTNYKKDNPDSSISPDMIPSVQYEHQQLRNGDTFASMNPDQLQIIRNGLSPGYMGRDISKVDGFMGPKTAMQYYPTAIRHNDDGSMQNFGTDLEGYVNSFNQQSIA